MATPLRARERDRRLDGVRALVVDDNLDHLEIMRRLLAYAGARVDTARTAQEAFEALEGGSYDVLVSDLAMPQVTGYNLIRRIRRSGRASGLRAVAMTAFAADEHREKALEAGFDEWVAKPASDSVVQLVAVLLRR